MACVMAAEASCAKKPRNSESILCQRPPTKPKPGLSGEAPLEFFFSGAPKKQGKKGGPRKTATEELIIDMKS